MDALHFAVAVMAPLSLSMFVFALVLGKAFTGPALYHDSDSSHPLSAVSELSSRLAAAAHAQDARLPLPTPQEIEAIKKVAQVLVMIGEQVIPAIIGEPPSGNCDPPVVDVPTDTVAEKTP